MPPVDTLHSLLIDTPGGLHVPLEQVATIQVREGSLNISRESGLRVQSIGVFIRGGDMGSIVKEMQENVAKAIHLPTGYYITWGGEFENQERAMGRLSVIVPVSVVLLFILLFEAFQSVKSAALILMNAVCHNRRYCGWHPLDCVGGDWIYRALWVKPC